MAQKNQGQNQNQQPKKDPNAPKGDVKQPGQGQQGDINQDRDQMGRRDKMGQQGGKDEVTDVEREIASDEDVLEDEERITQRNPAQGSDVERDR